MGLFTWLADKIISEKSEEEKLILDLEEGITFLKEARFKDKTNFLESLMDINNPNIHRYDFTSFLENIDKSISWLKEAHKRTLLLIGMLERDRQEEIFDSPQSYRKGMNLDHPGKEMLNFLAALEKELRNKLALLKKVHREVKNHAIDDFYFVSKKEEEIKDLIILLNKNIMQLEALQR